LSILAISAAWALSWSAPLRADAARDAYDEGVKAFDAGRFSEAAAAFHKAYELKRSWKIRYNIGQSEAAAKRFGLALDAFEAYLGEGGDDVDPARRDEVLAEIQRLRLLVGGIEIVGPAGATVAIDGVARGVLPLGTRLRETAGVDHEIVVVGADGVELLRRAGVRVGSGELVTVEVVAPAKAIAAPPTTANAAAESAPPAPAGGSGHGPLWTAGWVAVGIGAATAIVGAITGGMALAKQADLEKACPDRSCTSAKDLDLRDSADALGLATDVLLPAGAVLAAAGAVLLIVDAKKGGERAAVAVMPQIGGTGAGLSMEGRF
jgi:hypothetical protein